MDIEELEKIGFLKYQGDGVPKGIIDAASAGSALIGLDEAIRYFNEKQSPGYAKLEYQIPVKIEGGSWVAYVLGGIGAGAGVFTLSYLKKAGEKMAENDVGDNGLGDVLKKSFEAIQSFIRLIKHTKKKNWDTSNFKWKDGNSKIGIPDKDGEYLFLPTEHFKWISQAPQKLLIRVTEVVSTDRTLSIGVKKGGSFNEVNVSNIEKPLFHDNELLLLEEEFLFPELQHGKQVKLEGKITRGNESSNSIGLEYGGHILNCVPEEGSIVQFKPALFLKCVVHGTITRLSKKTMVAEKKPTIIVSRVTPLESDGQDGLF
jgi:hypothetical protein